MGPDFHSTNAFPCHDLQHTPAEQFKEEAIESESKVADGSAAPVTTSPEEAHATTSTPATATESETGPTDSNNDKNSALTASTVNTNGADDNASMIPLGKGANTVPPLGTDTADVSGAATPAVTGGEGNDTASIKTSDTSRADIDAAKQAIIQAVINCKLSREVVFSRADNDIGNEDGSNEVKRVLGGYKGIEAALAEMNRDIPVHIRDNHDLGFAESERLKKQDNQDTAEAEVPASATGANASDADIKPTDPTDTAVSTSGPNGINGVDGHTEDASESHNHGAELGAGLAGAAGAGALATAADHTDDSADIKEGDSTEPSGALEDEALPSSPVDKGKGRAIDEDPVAAPVSPSKPPQGEKLFDRLKREVEERARLGQLGQFNKANTGAAATSGTSSAASASAPVTTSKPSVDAPKASDGSTSVADAEAGDQSKAVSTPSAFTEEFGPNDNSTSAGSPTTPTTAYNSPATRARTASMSSQTSTGKQGGLLGGLFRRRSKRQSLADGPATAGGRRASQDLGRTVSRDTTSAAPAAPSQPIPESKANVDDSGAAPAATTASQPEEANVHTSEEPSANTLTIAETSEVPSSEVKDTDEKIEPEVLPLNETTEEPSAHVTENKDESSDLLPETMKLAPLAAVAAAEPVSATDAAPTAVGETEETTHAKEADTAVVPKEEPAAPPATPAYVGPYDEDKPLASGTTLERTPSKGGFLGLFRRRSSRKSSSEIKRTTSDVGKPMPIVTTTNSNALSATPIATQPVSEVEEPVEKRGDDEDTAAADTTIIDHDASEHADFHTEPHSPRDMDELETVQEELERGPDETVGEPGGAVSVADDIDERAQQHEDRDVSSPVDEHDSNQRATDAPLASPLSSHSERPTSPRVAMTPAERLLDHGKGDKGEKRKSSGGFFSLFRSRTVNNKERPPSYTPNPDITNAVANVGIAPKQKTDRPIEKRDVAVGTDDVDEHADDDYPVAEEEPEEEIPDNRSITEIAASTPLPQPVYTEKTRAKHDRQRKKREHEEAVERERIRRENDILNKRERILNAYTGKQGKQAMFASQRRLLIDLGPVHRFQQSTKTYPNKRLWQVPRPQRA